MNDLLHVVVHSRVKQYVDDTTIYEACTSPSDLSQHLTADLATVAGWVEQNGLKLNEAKTQLLLLGRKRRSDELRAVALSLKGREVKLSSKVRLIGVWVDEGLSWKDHVEAVR